MNSTFHKYSFTETYQKENKDFLFKEEDCDSSLVSNVSHKEVEDFLLSNRYSSLVFMTSILSNVLDVITAKRSCNNKVI